jgi:UrcA family protein
MFTSKSTIFSVSFALLMAAGLLLRADAVLAQDTARAEAGTAIEEVIVEAPVVRRKVAASSPTGYTTEMIQLRRQVSFDDLDLTQDSDVKKLEERIEITAKEACQALDDMLDRDQQDATAVFRCTKQAIKDTREEFEAVVAAAE